MRKLLGVFLFVFMMAVLASPAVAGDNVSNMEITIDEAVKRALGRDISLKMSEYDRDRAKIVRDDATYAFNPNWITTGEGGSERLYTSMLTSDLNWQIAMKNYQSKQDAVLIKVHQKYYNVLFLKKDLEDKELVLKRDDRKLKVARISYDVGLISRLELDQAEIQRKKSQAAVVSTKILLDNAYSDFNELIGLDYNDRPVLTSDVAYSPSGDDLQLIISKAVDESPAISNARDAVEVKDLTAGMVDPVDAGKIDVDLAELNVNKAKELTKQLVRNIYQSVKNMEEQIAVLERAVSIAEKNLRDTKLRFDLGMVTETEVLQAEESLVAARKDLSDLVYKHAIQKMYLEKPWLSGI